MTFTLPGQISHGISPADPMRELSRTDRDLQRQIDEMKAAAAQQNVIQSVYLATSGQTFPNDNAWHDYGLSTAYVVPPNCTRLTWFLWATSGTSFSAGQTGVLEVQIGAGNLANGSDQFGQGPYIAQTSGTATGMAMTSQVTWTGSVPNQGGITGPGSSGSGAYTPGSTIYLSVYALAAGASNAGSSGVNLNGVLIWSRS